jgi:hypothetical protein
MVKLDNPGDWTIRTANSQTNQFIGGYAVLAYDSDHVRDCGPPQDGLPALCGDKVFTSAPSDQPKLGFAGNALSEGYVVLDPLALSPFPPLPPIASADHTILWDMSQPNDRVWKIDDEPFLAWRDDQEPAILDVQPSLEAGVAIAIDNGTVVDIVINIPGGQPTHASLRPYQACPPRFRGLSLLHLCFFSRSTNMRQSFGCKSVSVIDMRRRMLTLENTHSIGEGSGPFIWSDVATAQAAVPNSFNLHNPSYRGR